MLVYSNHSGMPHNVNIFYNRNDEYPYTLETIHFTSRYRTLEELLSFMTQEGLTSIIGTKMIEEKIRIAVSGCDYFPGRKCRGCSYASDPRQFDPICLYGHDEALSAVDECLS